MAGSTGEALELFSNFAQRHSEIVLRGRFVRMRKRREHLFGVNALFAYKI